MNSMIEWLAGSCKKHLLEEKWLLADDLRIAQQWKDQLNLAGHASINLHSKTLRSLAVSLVGEVLATQKISFASQATARMLVHSIVSEMLERSELEYFNTVNSIDGLCDLLAKSIRDLRLADVEPKAMAEKDFESAAKARDVIRVYQAYCERLLVDRAADYAACIDLATKGIHDGTIKLPRGLLVLVPEELNRLTKAEQGLFEAISKKATIARPNLESFSEEAARRRISERLSAGEATFEYFSGLGEVNEIRGFVQRILSKERGGPRRFDNVEILHTDYQQYVPLFLELFSTWLASSNDNEAKLPSIDKLPLTFAEGIACIYSRPGRALRSWLRWTRADFVQTKAVQLLREGLLAKPAKAEEIGYSRLANTLRRVPIGFKSDRYLVKLDEAILSAKQSQKEYEQLGDKEENQGPADDHEKHDFGLPALEAVFAIMKPLVNHAPNSGNDAVSVLEKARSFLLQCVRAESKLDRYARGKLLNEINGMLATLQSTPDSQFDVLQWLEDLPVQSCIFAGGPMPGCIHIAPIAHGGHTGRKELYLVGLDDGRYPRRSPVDPILLDAERGRLSKDLQTAESHSRYQQQSLDRVLFRVLENVDVRVSFSYSVRNFADDRQCFPSASMLEMFRMSYGQPEAHMDDLLVELGQPISFVSKSPDDHLTMAEIGLVGILMEKDETERLRLLEEQFEHTAQCRIAREFQEAPQVSEYDGLVPRAGEDLDPAAGEPISPSRLETYGTCPRRFFFQRGLGVYPPEEWNVDSESWLDQLQFGNLVHELFEDFLRGQTASGLTPSFARDRTPLVALLHSKIELLKLDMPIPNEDAFLRQREQLEEICEIFLSKEEEYCREHNARPWILESSFGLPGELKSELDCTEPISLTFSDGRVLRVSGRVDRVDKLRKDGSEKYVIWDYKSGSNFGFSHDKPFAQGRKLQPYLYVGMLRHRIAATGGDPDAVDSFGYFFPNPKMAGLRLRWTRGELRGGDEVLRHICDSIAAGVFLATTNQDDCTYCDYLSVCGNPGFVAKESRWKASQSVNQVLEPIRRLRDIAVEPEAAQ